MLAWIYINKYRWFTATSHKSSNFKGFSWWRASNSYIYISYMYIYLLDNGLDSSVMSGFEVSA